MATQGQLSAAPQSVFVGRRAELGALEEELEHVRGGRLARRARRGRGGHRQDRADRALPGAVDDVTVLRASGDESERDLPVRRPRAAVAAGGDPVELGGDHVAAGAHLLERLGALDDGLPLAVVIDDAHWADPASLRALLFVVRRLVADHS